MDDFISVIIKTNQESNAVLFSIWQVKWPSTLLLQVAIATLFKISIALP